MAKSNPNIPTVNIITADPITQKVIEGEFEGSTTGVLDVVGVYTPSAELHAIDTGITYQNISTTDTPNFVDISTPRAGTITRAMQTAAAASKDISVTSMVTIPTAAGNTDSYVIAPETGTLSSIDFSALAALATDNTNYVTFSVTNLGQAGAGSTAMLAASDANTTKTTGGSAISANTKRTLSLSAVANALNVVAGDRLLIRVAGSGTLANTVTAPTFMLRFGGTT